MSYRYDVVAAVYLVNNVVPPETPPSATVTFLFSGYVTATPPALPISYVFYDKYAGPKSHTTGPVH